MELKEFFKLLLKYKYIIITVPIITVIITFFLVKHLPDEYESHGQISTGIVDQTRQMLDPISSTIQETMVSGKFSNLIEVMKMKKMLDMVSYKLIIHDLSSSKPFKPLPKYYIHMKAADNAKAIAVFQYKMDHLEPLYLTTGGRTYDDWLAGLLVGKHYDERTLAKAFTITRDEDSDFISVSCSTDNPDLSAFMVNSLIQGFIEYQTSILKHNEAGALNYLTKLLKEKGEALARKTDSLQRYKIANGILNLEDQAKTTAEQISTNDERLLQVQKDEDSYRGAIDNINQKFEPQQRQYIESRVTKYNAAVTSTQAKAHALTDKYVNSNFDPKIGRQLDSLKKQATEQINQTSDQYINNPLVGKDDLVKQKNTLEVSYDLARYGREAIESQQKKLRGRFNKLVPLDAKVKTYQFDIENASKEYQETLSKYNLTNLQSSTSTKLLQVEVAVPELAQPSKKMLLTILSGIVAGVFCVIILFVVFFLDDGIKNPNQLANATNLPVLGYLNLISGSTLDLRKLWDVEHRDKMQQFKDLLRAIRFEIDQELNGEKVLAIASMRDGEGKTLLAISLAYSYSMINKKVLLIDGNFDNPTISQTVNPKIFVEELFKNSPGNYDQLSPANSVAGNHGGDVTLLEIGDERFIRQKMNELKSIYDVIIIETPPIDSMNKAKEWLLFSNKFVAVFEAGQTIANGRKQLVKYLQGMDQQFAGWILNKTLYNIKKKRKR